MNVALKSRVVPPDPTSKEMGLPNPGERDTVPPKKRGIEGNVVGKEV